MGECNERSGFGSISGNTQLLGSQTSLTTRQYVLPRLSLTNIVEWWSDLKNSRKAAVFISIFLFFIVIFAIVLTTRRSTDVEVDRQNTEGRNPAPEQHHLHMSDQLNQISKLSHDSLTEPFSKKAKSKTNSSSNLLELDQKLSDLGNKVDFLTKFQNSTSDFVERLENLEKGQQVIDFKEKLGSMITRPLAFLYTEKNQRGQLFVYNDEGSDTPGCMNLTSNIKSVDTMGTCVRLFTKASCFGLSLPFFTGSPRHHENLYVSDKPDGFTSVSSVGPCLVNELDGATIKVITWKNMEVNVFNKARHLDSLVVPDFLYSGPPENSHNENSEEELDFEFTPFSSEEATQHILRPQGRNSGPILSSVSTGHLGGSISMGHRGHGGRIEYLETIGLNFTHLLRDWETEERSLFFNLKAISFTGLNWVTSEVQNFFNGLDKKAGDQLGLVISLKLGGPRDVPENVFPQSLTNLKLKATLESKIISNIRKSRNSKWRIEVNFDYANSTSTRPTGFTYRLNKVGTNLFQSFYLSNF